jgi:5'-3' exonuclease
VRRLLLDTSSLMYRAFFALPDSIKDPRGRPVNALHGYLDMTGRLIEAREPDEVLHVFDDDWRPAARVELYPGYKANRAVDPHGLPEQFGLLREILGAFGMIQAEAPGWEAEDAIGALCIQAEEADRIDIVTGDRDLIQLVRDPIVRVLFTRKGVSELDVLDEAGVLGKFGVPATRYADFAILRGDPSDELPGLPGVGQKTAQLLVQAYPTLDALMEDARAEKRTGAPLRRSPKLRATIRDSVDYLAAMRQVVPIRTDVAVRIQTSSRNDAHLDDLAERLNLKGPLRRVRQTIEKGNALRRPPEPGPGPGEPVVEPAAVPPAGPPYRRGTPGSPNAD